MVAPDWSVTVPETAAETWAKAGDANRKMPSAESARFAEDSDAVLAALWAIPEGRAQRAPPIGRRLPTCPTKSARRADRNITGWSSDLENGLRMSVLNFSVTYKRQYLRGAIEQSPTEIAVVR